MDMEISQLNVKYYNNLVNYNKILSERNSVLKCAKIDESMLDIYDMQLAQYGEYIIKARLEYLNSLNKYSKQIHSDITSGKEEINFEYISNVKNLDNIKESLLNLLRKSRKKDIEKEYERFHMTDDEKKSDDEKKIADKHRRKLKELDDDPFALADYIDSHKEEHKIYRKYY